VVVTLTRDEQDTLMDICREVYGDSRELVDAIHLVDEHWVFPTSLTNYVGLYDIASKYGYNEFADEMPLPPDSDELDFAILEDDMISQA
jgi:hypothetical protein